MRAPRARVTRPRRHRSPRSRSTTCAAASYAGGAQHVQAARASRPAPRSFEERAPVAGRRRARRAARGSARSHTTTLVRAHRGSVLRIEDRAATARDDERYRRRAHVRDRAALARRKPPSPSAAKISLDGPAGGRLDDLVGVDEGPTQRSGAAGTDRRLAGTHQPDEHEVTPSFGSHGGTSAQGRDVRVVVAHELGDRVATELAQGLVRDHQRHHRLGHDARRRAPR